MERLSFRVLITLKIGSIIGVTQSAIWIVLCVLSLLSYHLCKFGSNIQNTSDIFGVIMHRYFFLESTCSNFMELEDTQVLTAQQVNTWVIIMLSLNIIWFFSSLVLFLYAFAGWTKYVFFVAYAWVFAGGAVAILDITLGVLFGMTYGRIQYIIEEGFVNELLALELAMLQLVTLCLMTIALKGYIMLIFNLATVISMLAIICDKYAVGRPNDQDIIMDPIHAYGSTNGSRRFSHSTGERTSWRRGPRENNSDRIYTSGEWPPTPVPNDVDGPFSYIEEPIWHMHKSNPQARNLPRRPLRRPDDRFDNSPQLPEPDYSPIQHRRLKSVLKPTA